MKPRILIVEDDFLVATGLARHMTRLGFEVLGPFARIEDAYLAREDADLAILDFNLGDHSSIDLAHALVERNTPILFVTGYSKLRDLPDALADVPTIQKPFHHGRLERLVNQLLDSAG